MPNMCLCVHVSKCVKEVVGEEYPACVYVPMCVCVCVCVCVKVVCEGQIVCVSMCL